jgi:quinol monooxygenase YgiN
MSEKPEGTTRREFVAASAGAAAVAAFGFNRIAQAQDDDELITQIVKFKIMEGQEDAAVELLETLTAAVEKEEPGVLAYIAHRSKKDPSEVVFFEIYKDQAAVTAHGTTPHMAELRQKFASTFVPPLDVQPLDRVGGFTR